MRIGRINIVGNNMRINNKVFRNWCYPSEISGLHLWLDANQIIGKIDGDAISQWDDLSGLGHHAIQVTGIKQPLYKTGIVNGKPVVRFDGINDVMACAIHAMEYKTWFVVAQKRAIPTTTTQVSFGDNSVVQIYADTDQSSGWWYYDLEGAPTGFDLQGNTLDWTIICLKYIDRNNLKPYINGKDGEIQNPNDNYVTTAGIFLGGGNATPNSPCDIDIAEAILFDTALSDENRLKIEHYLLSKYGIIWGSGIVPVWTKVGTILAATEAFEENNIYESSIIYENNPQILIGEPNVFKMWYSGGWLNSCTNYAESVDGINWTKYTGNPIIATKHCRNSIIKSGVIYYLYVARNEAPYCIDLYTSINGVAFVLDTAACLEHGAGGDWDDVSIANTSVWLEGVGDWRMLYEANGGSGWNIGYATSVDGKTWTKYVGNPVMPHMSGPSTVYKIGINYWVWVHGNFSSSLPTDIYRYTSTDCMTWTRDPLHITLARTTADEGIGIATGQVSDPFLLEIGGKTYLWYSASSDGSAPTGNMHIKLATVDMSLAQLVLTDECV